MSVNMLASWEEFRSFRGGFGLFDVAIQCRAGPWIVQIFSHEASKFTETEAESSQEVCSNGGFFVQSCPSLFA